MIPSKGLYSPSKERHRDETAQEVPEGHTIITEGDLMADYFYVVQAPFKGIKMDCAHKLVVV